MALAFSHTSRFYARFFQIPPPCQRRQLDHHRPDRLDHRNIGARAGAHRASRSDTIWPTGTRAHCGGVSESGGDERHVWHRAFLLHRCRKTGFTQLFARLAPADALRHSGGGCYWSGADDRLVLAGVFTMDGAGGSSLIILGDQWLQLFPQRYSERCSAKGGRGLPRRAGCLAEDYAGAGRAALVGQFQHGGGDQLCELFPIRHRLSIYLSTPVDSTPTHTQWR